MHSAWTVSYTHLDVYKRQACLMETRVYNFSAGPAVMPESVLKQASEEMLCHGSDGMSVMEMSHRSPMYERIIFGAEADLRALMHIPDNYKVLFLQGGASLQFSMVPMNLYRNSFSADFIDTGSWTQKAMKECQKIGKVNVLASSKADNFAYIPQVDPQKMDPNADFLYLSLIHISTVKQVSDCFFWKSNSGSYESPASSRPSSDFCTCAPSPNSDAHSACARMYTRPSSALA